jgi:hypothetical protein
MKLLESGMGEVQSPSDQWIDIADRLSRAMERLAGQVEGLQQRLIKVERDNAVLLKLLSPLYKGLRPVFGDAEPSAELSDSSGNGSSGSVNASVWAAWKQRLTPNAGKIIDALLTHRELSSTQIAIATGIAGGNVAKYVYELNKAGLINKAGGKMSLKSL